MSLQTVGEGQGAAAANRRRRPIRRVTVIKSDGRRIRHDMARPVDYEFGLGDSAEEDDDDNADDEGNEETPLIAKDVNTEERAFYAFQKSKYHLQQHLHKAWAFITSKTGRNVLKCSIAYTLGSMATFIPAISNILGRQDGKHMVATVTVYYHPARSLGSMMEASICAAVAFLYAVFISFSSMAVSVFFGRTLDRIILGHVLVLIIFCGAGMGFIGWTKQRLGNPLVNVSCSLTSLAIITVLTKEGAVQAAEFSNDKVTQVMIMILMGIAATTAVAILIEPTSAKFELRDDLAKVTHAFGQLLIGITAAFLHGSEDQLCKEAYLQAVESNNKVFSSLTKKLGEAKYEYYVLGLERHYNVFAKLVNCLQRLSHNIGGLRSAADTQFLLLAESGIEDTSTRHTEYERGNLEPQASVVGASRYDSGSPTLNYMVSNHSPSNGDSMITHYKGRGYTEVQVEPPSSEMPADIFLRFIKELGPSMKSLAITMKDILDKLPYQSDGAIAFDAHFVHSITAAIELYSKSRQEALDMMYQSKDLSKARSIKVQADFEEIAASCGYFSFSLQDFGHELRALLRILDDLKLELEERPKGRSWTWLKFWQSQPQIAKVVKERDPERDTLVKANAETDLPGDLQSSTKHKIETFTQKTNRDWKFRMRLKVWHTLDFFTRDDIKFAIKVGIGAALYALPSFLESTRSFYQHWRGEWGLLSYMLVCSMTKGASNTTGYSRFIGTCIGAVCAIISWTASNGNAYLLAFFGWLMSLWTSYIIVAKGNGPMGRFIMLTYNLSALYAYSLSVKEAPGDEDEGGIDPIISEIALHRVMAVFSGCLWGLVITRVIWPVSARAKFKDGLSILWLRMAMIWQRDPLKIITEHDRPCDHMDLQEEFDLRRYLSRLDNLKGAASSEVDLKAPFPDKAYGKILSDTRAMLDAFHAMNVMTVKNPRASKGEIELLKYTSNERGALCIRISHLFQVLASSMKLEFPMNNALPSIDHTRDRLLTKIFRFRRDIMSDRPVDDADFELLYAFALVTGQLSQKIKDIGVQIEELFGVLDEDLLKLQ